MYFILMMRLNWHEYFSKIAQVTSERSSDTRLQVGCVIVKDNRIISCGYNGNLSGVDNNKIEFVNNSDVLKVHAEANAISDCAKRGVSTNDSICYVTHRPCLNCYKLLVSSGISKIYYLNDYKNDEIVTNLVNSVYVPVTKI